MHEIADAVDVEDDEIFAVAVDDALELADHARACLAYLVATTTAAPAIMVPPARLSRRMARAAKQRSRTHRREDVGAENEGQNDHADAGQFDVAEEADARKVDEVRQQGEIERHHLWIAQR